MTTDSDIWDEVAADLDAPFTPPAPAAPKPAVVPLDSSAAEEWVADLILDHEMNRPRSRQAAIGPSGIGDKCDRKIAMTLAGVEAVHFSDPLKAWVGTGVHHMLEEAVRLKDRETGRFLVEHPVTYRGISGNVDLFDRVRGRVIDWKSKELSKIKRLRKSGKMDDGYRVQQMTYGAGLVAAGENVRSVALAYIPTNGDLRDVYVQEEIFLPEVADAAIDRIDSLREQLEEGKDAETFLPTTSALCGWCPFYNPLTPTSARSCQGGARP
jgi:hypothetical protein